MYAVSRRRGFTLRDLFMTILVISIGLALLVAVLPRMRRHGPSARNACISNMRQLVLSLHNHLDVYKRFPAIAGSCENLVEQRIGYGSGQSPDCTMAQFSWIVRILPYIEEGALYNELSADSMKFQIAAFDSRLRVGQNNDSSKQHFSQTYLAVLSCPSFKGGKNSDNRSPASSYSKIGAPKRSPFDDPIGVALTNYVAIAATHKERLIGRENDPPLPNGVLLPGTGTALANIADGIGHTMMLAETKETSNSSWYDSSGTWVVALLPRHDLPTNLDPVDFPIADAARMRSTLNVGPTEQERDGYGKELPSSAIRRWGPSSDHAGDIVVHGFADGSVRPIGADIDPFVYAALVTPNGGEKIGVNNVHE